MANVFEAPRQFAERLFGEASLEDFEVKQKLDELRTLAIKLYESGQAEMRKQPPEIWGDQRERKYRDMPSEGVAVWDAIALAALKATTPKKDSKSMRLYDALKSIASYDSPKQVHGCAAPMGLEENEALEMAYENIIAEAKAAIFRMRRPTLYEVNPKPASDGNKTNPCAGSDLSDNGETGRTI